MKTWLSLALSIALLLALPTVAFAAEDGRANAPAGIGLLILLLGILAIAIVSGYYIRQNQLAAEEERKAREQ
ncbi:MAG: hypothetical protein CUN51_08330 [Candidatus Thermofonsia Clade 1 bacterium]|uniref:CcmD family protein n=1 Tax=Candidatus Thermofonsia Clade 1 bacterium TaxID=2364210 RepID=A0A2M8NYD2_9CHLR|nr:MAG: hypothetical protein CUN51_08330 [Candidatus Thermofonsia Clade 1 bacterium]